jgi:hypothetical protein
VGADIGGSLNCSKGTFENEDGYALSADRLKVGSGVFLRSIRAKGEVRLLGADIGGDLDCSKGTFENEDGRALNADGLKTKGNVFLRGGFHAKGAVCLVGADIGGVLDCSRGVFGNVNSVALDAEGLKTKDNVNLSNMFYAIGEVCFLNAEIGTNLSCNEGTFENENGVAFNAERMNVKGTFKWRLTKRPRGKVDLTHATVGQLYDNMHDIGSWPDKGKLFLDGFKYDALASKETPRSVDNLLEWLKLQPEEHLKLQPYEQLAKVYRLMGHEKYARTVLIEKHKELRRHGKLYRGSYIRNWVLDVTVGYGWQPGKALWFIAALIFIGMGLFWSADFIQVMQPSKERVYLDAKFKKTGELPSQYPVFNPLSYSMDTFIPFVDLHQENYWLPNTNRHMGWFYRVYLWFHICLGWFFSTLAVLSFTSIIRKD